MVKLILSLIAISMMVSCKKLLQPNYIVIAVEKLNSKAINCHESDVFSKRSGFEMLCSEFYRFTQTYTTSIQSLPAFASLLTGYYPYSHNVRYNSHTTLTPEFKTFPEIAFESGFKTVFVASSPPFLKKSGIAQGFDIFDDGIVPELGNRNFKDTFQIMLNYIKDFETNPFVAVIQLGDLKYTFKETQNDLGELRNLSFDSQLESFDEKLFFFFQELKRLKLWDNTKVILVGLNGHLSSEYQTDPRMINLNSVNSQVALFFKDTKNNRMNSKPNSISTVLSLKDIGQMLTHSFTPAGSQEANFSAFKEVTIEKHKKSDPELIVIESGWPQWNHVGSIRSAVLDNSYLFINDKEPKLYNKLTDNLEKYSQPINDSTRTKVESYLQVLAAKNFSPFVRTPELNKLLEDIKALDGASVLTEKSSEFFDYQYILKKNLNISAREARLLLSKHNLIENPCFAYFSQSLKSEFLKKCKNKMAQFLFNQYVLKQLSDKELRFYFQKNAVIFNLIKQIHGENASLGLDYIPVTDLKIAAIQNYLYQSLKSITAIQNGDSGSN